MTDRELMQQALDALEEINKLSVGENAICLPAEIDTAMDALRDRLAQPERQWVGLTKEEATEISLANRPYVTDMIAALEARLKEKNA